MNSAGNNLERVPPRCVRYHAHCLDGIVAAALAARAFDVREYLPYTHAAAGTIPEFVEGAVGVDIPLIPGMVVWFDHHATGPRFFTPDVVTSYGKPMSVDVRYDPAAPACAVLLPHPPAFAPLLAEVARLDGALYASAAEATDLENPIIRTSATIIRKRDHAFDRTIITALVNATDDPIPMLAASIPADDDAATRRAWTIDRELLARHGILDRGVLTFDATAHPEVTMASYFLADAIFPAARYVVLCMHERDRIAVQCSVNPWSTTPMTTPPALDRIAATYGGGGHARIAAVKYPATAEGLTHANATFTAIAEELRAA